MGGKLALKLLVVGALAVGPVGAEPFASAGERAPGCFGKRATIVGNPRSNRIVGTGRADVIVGGRGNDIVFGRGGNDLICGGPGHDELYGGPGKDGLRGGPGDDFFGGAGGNDLILGGRGRRDFAQYLGGPRRVRVDLGRGVARGWGKDRLRGIEYAGGTRFGDVLRGKRGRNFLFGQGGDDRLFGRGGNDFLFAGGGDDVLVGGDGFDAADYTLSGRGVVVNLDGGTATGEGSDRIAGVEDAWGSRFADTLIGDSTSNQLFGWDGSDELQGGAGPDLLVPGAGADAVDGGPGDDFADFYFLRLSRLVAFRPVTVDLGAGTASGHGDDSLTRVENVSATDSDDLLLGDGGPNVMFALNGSDEIYGLGGNDWVDGGSGDDFLSGGGGDDWCTTGERFTVPPDCETDEPPDGASLGGVSLQVARNLAVARAGVPAAR